MFGINPVATQMLIKLWKAMIVPTPQQIILPDKSLERILILKHSRQMNKRRRTITVHPRNPSSSPATANLGYEVSVVRGGYTIVVQTFSRKLSGTDGHNGVSLLFRVIRVFLIFRIQPRHDTIPLVILDQFLIRLNHDGQKDNQKGNNNQDRAPDNPAI